MPSSSSQQTCVDVTADEHCVLLCNEVLLNRLDCSVGRRLVMPVDFLYNRERFEGEVEDLLFFRGSMLRYYNRTRV